MTDTSDFFDDDYRPEIVMERVKHLPKRKQQDIERIARIIRASFGYGDCELPRDGRIVRIVLVEFQEGSRERNDEIGLCKFHVVVNRPECADDAQWRLARAIISKEFCVTSNVTISIRVDDAPSGIVLYDSTSDVPLNARELSVKP